MARSSPAEPRSGSRSERALAAPGASSSARGERRAERRERGLPHPRELVAPPEERGHLPERGDARERRERGVDQPRAFLVRALLARERGEEERRDHGREHVVRVDREDGSSPREEAPARRAALERADEAVEGEERARFAERVGPRVLRLVDELRPSLVFLDVIMPEMDGWAVLAALKSNPAWAEIPVIMLTILQDSELGYVLGATEFLTKPIDRQRLAAVLQKYRVGQVPEVLIVEDDDSTRQIIRRTLTNGPFTS